MGSRESVSCDRYAVAVHHDVNDVNGPPLSMLVPGAKKKPMVHNALLLLLVGTWGE